MNPTRAKSADPSGPRSAMRALHDTLISAWTELTRLNSLGLEGSDARPLTRTARAARVRDTLSHRYRDRTPCC